MSREKSYNNTISVGSRIKHFALYKFGTVKNLAEFLKMDPRNLDKYAQDKMAPGTPLLLKLFSLGCDLSWLLTGQIPHRKSLIIERIKQSLLKNKMTIEDLKLIVFDSVKLDLSEISLMTYSDLSRLCWEYSVRCNLDYFDLYYGCNEKELKKWIKKNIVELSETKLFAQGPNILMDMYIKFGYGFSEAQELLEFYLHTGLSKELLKPKVSKQIISKN